MGSQECPFRIQGRILGCHTTGDITPQEKSKKRENPWNSLGPKMSQRKPVRLGSSDSDADGPVQFHLTVFVYVSAPFRNPQALLYIPPSPSVIFLKEKHIGSGG